MKKLFIILSVLLCACTTKVGTVTSTESIDDVNCIYTVETPQTEYTFVDSCGKYPIGFEVNK